MTTCTKRIVALPIRKRKNTEWVQDTLEKRCGGVTLRPLQREALAEIATVGGGFFPIGVGHGKTLIALLAGPILECEVAILLVPASLRIQMNEELSRFSSVFKTLEKTHVLSYEELSRPEGTDLLNTLCSAAGDYSKVVMICDEAHRLKRLQSARTMRVVRFMQEHPKVHFVALSGTMTSKSLRDFSHLAELALRESSPVPHDRNHLESWAEVVDVDGRPGRYDWERIRPLWEWKFGKDKDRFFGLRTETRRSQVRIAFQERMRATQGIVCSEEGSLGSSLNLEEVKGTVEEKITHLYDTVLELEEDPAGNVITDPLHKHRVLNQLAHGFYYQWDWGETPEDLREPWLWRRNQWGRNVRAELARRARANYDSPHLVEARVREEIREGKSNGIHKALVEWDEIKNDAHPKPFAVWVDDSPIQHALNLLDGLEGPGILWFQGKAIEEKIKSLRPSFEICGAGKTFDQTSSRPLALSIRAHGVGKNLQAWSHQVVLSPPSSGSAWEQLLGRTHRAGQMADEVSVKVVQTYPIQESALLSAKKDARYIEETTGNIQKLNFCNWRTV